MHYPYIEINLDKIEHNAKVITTLCAQHGIKVAGVTKVTCGSPRVARALLRGGVAQVADSRVENIKRIKDDAIRAETILLRIPMKSEIEQAVELADISLNSELKIIDMLSEASIKRGKIHRIILMVDLGDLREGVLPDEVVPTVKKIKNIKGVNLIGIGTNLSCYGGVIPSHSNMSKLVELAEQVENELSKPLEIISGGNTSSLALVERNEMPKKINHLRIGEGILLGRETIERKPITNTYQDAFTLKAEVIELKDKPSIPYGERGQDTFGEKKEIVDTGIGKRAILGVGREDILLDGIVPLVKGTEILGASSDHLIIDVTNSSVPVQLGDGIPFSLSYGALLSSMTSSYVSKNWLMEKTVKKSDVIKIVGFPLSFGLNAKGTEQTPAVIREQGFKKKLESLGFTVEDMGDITVDENKIKNLSTIQQAAHASNLMADVIQKIIEQGQFPLVVGGDQIATLGIIIGAARVISELGLIWFDAHGDFNTMETTVTGDITGMPLAALSGFGVPELINDHGMFPKISAESIVLVGVRDLDDQEKVNLHKSKVTVFTMEEIDKYGMREVMSRAINIASAGTRGVHLSLDMDVLDDREVPGVRLPVKGGITYREAHLAMELIADARILTSLDIVEIVPSKDDNYRTIKLASELVCSVLGKKIFEK